MIVSHLKPMHFAATLDVRGLAAYRHSMSGGILSIDEFYQALPSKGGLLGLDLGTKTIGIATSDRSRTIAGSRKTMTKGKFGRDADALADLIATDELIGVIIGDPVNMDGSIGPRAQSSRAFARNLATKLGLPVALWDERLSTAEAERTLISAGMSRARRAEVIDSTAAAIILQGALDRMKEFAGDGL